MGFKLAIVAQDAILYEEDDVDFVVLPGGLGQLGVLKKHTPLLSALKKGKIKVKNKEQVEEFNTEEGFVEVLADKVTVLVS